MKITIFLISLLLVLLSNNLKAQKNNKYLICHYKFDNNTEDNSQYKNSGKIVGNVRSTENRFGIKCTAYEFDGKTGYIIIPNNDALKKITDILTITVWAKLSPQSDSSWFTICCKADTRDEFYDSPHFRFQLSEHQVSLNTDFTLQWNQKFDKDKWYFFAITVSKTNMKVYINGNLALNTRLDHTLEVNNQPLLIGRDMPGRDEFFHGSMDDLRIYNKTLTASEINKIFMDKSDKNIKSPCSSQDSIQVIICNDLVKAGGNEVSIKKMDLGKDAGKFILYYDMFTIPDKLTIYSAKDNSILFTTKGYVKGTKTIKIKYQDTRFIIIKVEGNKKQQTMWKYKITCLD